jgi:hypothetical protein
MAHRAPLYEAVAHLAVRTDGSRVQALVDQIIAALPPGPPQACAPTSDDDSPGRIL